MYNGLYGIKITNKAVKCLVKCLRIYIDHDKENATLKIGWKYITILRNFLNLGKKKVTLLGKSCIVKTLAISKLILHVKNLFNKNGNSKALAWGI